MNQISVKVKDFNLDHIFGCGQCFRWQREDDGSYTGVAFEKAVNLSIAKSKGECEDKADFDISLREASEYTDLIIKNADEDDFIKNWEHYLDLKRDYGFIKSRLSSNDPVIKDAIMYGNGIRILKQELWETLISFIVSQNNNIPRIKGCIENLCINFGKPLGIFMGKERFSFPTFERLSQLTVSDLEVCRLGYRARYIIETAKMISKDEGTSLMEAEKKDTADAYTYLLGLSGVGPKVANCILLFGMGKYDSFPIDVWMKRVMNKLYGMDENDVKSMYEYATNSFAPWEGIAQQYLFYYIQSKGMLL